MKEAADELRISVRHLRDMIVQHGIPVLRLGRRVVLDDVSFEAIERACRVATKPLALPQWVVNAPPPRRAQTSAERVLAEIAERNLKGSSSV